MPKDNGKRLSGSGLGMKRLVRISKKYLKLLCGVKDKQPEPLPPPSLPYFQQGDRVGPEAPKSVARVGESAVRLNQDGTVSSFDGKVLTMADMRAQADQRNAQGQLGSMLGSGLLGQQSLLAQALIRQQQQASQQGLGLLDGIIGDLESLRGNTFSWGSSLSLPEPKPKTEIPIQEPVGKRRIKLRD